MDGQWVQQPCVKGRCCEDILDRSDSDQWRLLATVTHGGVTGVLLVATRNRLSAAETSQNNAPPPRYTNPNRGRMETGGYSGVS